MNEEAKASHFQDSNRYSVGSFIKDHVQLVVGTIVLLIFITVVLKVFAISNGGIVVVDGSLVLCVGAYLVITYIRRASFWHELENCLNSLDRVGHLQDLVDQPDFLEGAIAYDSLCAVAKLANEEITALKMAEDSNSEYINLWVHEVKTPLAAARLMAEGMQGSDAVMLKRELERIEALVQQALYAARSESLAHDYFIREINLAEVVREASKANMHYLMSLNVSVDVYIDPAYTVYADKQWLGFILAQLLTNAAKYDAKTITITATIPEQESSSSCTILEIKDDGCGIPAEDVPRVFERGFTGKVGREHGSATGMGLYLVARMCNQMGLGILLASEKGIGTRLEITFPHDRRKMNLTNL